jgi:glutamate--cysteine ligase catalytic subunit
MLSHLPLNYLAFDMIPLIFEICVSCSSFLLPKIVGLLKVGVPQPWEKSKKNLNYVREAGVRQFISTYNRVKDLKGDELLWGDEIEYGIFVLDADMKKIRLSLRAKEVREGCAFR